MVGRSCTSNPKRPAPTYSVLGVQSQAGFSVKPVLLMRSFQCPGAKPRRDTHQPLHATTRAHESWAAEKAHKHLLMSGNTRARQKSCDFTFFGVWACRTVLTTASWSGFSPCAGHHGALDAGMCREGCQELGVEQPALGNELALQPHPLS